jgi:hypothetical protein
MFTETLQIGIVELAPGAELNPDPDAVYPPAS